MMHSKWLACVAALLTIAVGDGQAQGRARGAQQPAEAAGITRAPIQYGPVTGNAARGKDLYHSNTCYGCHGFNGETGARDLVGTNSPILATEDSFIRFLRLRADQAPILPSTRMPNYGAEALSDKDAKDIYAFIRSFKLNAPTVNNVATLRKILKMAEEPYKP